MDTLNRAVGFAWCVAAALGTTAAFAADEKKTLTLDARGLQTLRIEADEGFLHIQGVPGLETIEVTAEIDEGGREFRLTLEKNGDSAVLISDLTEWGFRRSHIHLTIRTPDRLSLDVDDDSGEVIVSGMRANARIRDDSGYLSVKDHRGKLAIEDDSGDIELQGIAGDVSVEDDSGSMELRDINGNVTIRDDSGAMRIENVTGHLTIHDGSGGITIANVSQGLTIKESGSGGLSTTNIGGPVDVRE